MMMDAWNHNVIHWLRRNQDSGVVVSAEEYLFMDRIVLRDHSWLGADGTMSTRTTARSAPYCAERTHVRFETSTNNDIIKSGIRHG